MAMAAMPSALGRVLCNRRLSGSGRMSLKRRRRRVPQVVEYSTNSGKLGSATANPGASTDLLHAMRA